MGRRINTEKLEQKIEKGENAIGRNREQYDMLTAKLEELHNQQRQLRCEELMKAVESSSRSYEDIMRYIRGGSKK